MGNFDFEDVAISETPGPLTWGVGDHVMRKTTSKMSHQMINMANTGEQSRQEDIITCDISEVVFIFLAVIIPRSVDLGFLKL